jgi:hypothetical protein
LFSVCVKSWKIASKNYACAMKPSWKRKSKRQSKSNNVRFIRELNCRLVLDAVIRAHEEELQPLTEKLKTFEEHPQPSTASDNNEHKYGSRK